MKQAKATSWGALPACAVLILAGLTAAADDDKGKDHPALSGVWTLEGGQTKIAFSEKHVMKISPHGDNNVIVVICKYTADKAGLVKAKITDFEGKDEAKKLVKQMLPIGTEFGFNWKVKDASATLDNLKGDKIDVLKSHLEGKYRRKK